MNVSTSRHYYYSQKEREERVAESFQFGGKRITVATCARHRPTERGRRGCREWMGGANMPNTRLTVTPTWARDWSRTLMVGRISARFLVNRFLPCALPVHLPQVVLQVVVGLSCLKLDEKCASVHVRLLWHAAGDGLGRSWTRLTEDVVCGLQRW